jgi:hypothetical protein
MPEVIVDTESKTQPPLGESLNGSGTSTSSPTRPTNFAGPNLLVIPANHNTQLVAGAGLFSVGVLLGCVVLVGIVPSSLEPHLNSLTASAILCAVTGVVFGARGVGGLQKIELPDSKSQDFNRMQEAKFQRYLIGLGYSLALLSAINVIAIAGLTEENGANKGSVTKGIKATATKGAAAISIPSSNSVSPTEPQGSENKPNATNDDSNGTAKIFLGTNPVLFLFTISMALTGVLFFVASKIHSYASAHNDLSTAEKTPATANDVASTTRFSTLSVTGATPSTTSLGSAASAAIVPSPPEEHEHPEEFKEGKFWGGLWFRLGESVLFSLVAILLFRGAGISEPGSGIFFSLPITCLLMGMFIETAETFVSSASARMLAAVTALYGDKPK